RFERLRSGKSRGEQRQSLATVSSGNLAFDACGQWLSIFDCEFVRDTPLSVRTWPRENQQRPTPGGFPFLFEAGVVLFEEFALCGIVQEHKLTLLVQSCHDHVV